MVEDLACYICWEREEHRKSDQEYVETDWCLVLEISVSEREQKEHKGRRGNKRSVSLSEQNSRKQSDISSKAERREDDD